MFFEKNCFYPKKKIFGFRIKFNSRKDVKILDPIS